MISNPYAPYSINFSEMNAESSRSHLVVGIVIETTNKISGQVVKGKVKE